MQICGERGFEVERLTKWNESSHKHAYYPRCFEDPCYGSGCKIKDCPFETAVCERLAAYEDTGLTPEAVETVKLALAAKHLVDLETLNNTPISRLIELAEADKDGRCVVLPCKPGDMLYEVTNRKTISEYRVTAICVTLGGLFLEWEIKRGFAGRSAIGIIPDWIGKTVFLTREEAEKTMEGMENGNKTSL